MAVRVPSHIALAAWIRELAGEDKLYRFYKTDEWKALRREVMEDHGYTCSMCEERGKLSKADTVHHEYEVREHPHMALTRYVDDPSTGERREVLHPLCNRCHNEIHDRTFKGNEPKPQLNEEKW